MQAHLLHPLHARESLLHGQVEPGSERRVLVLCQKLGEPCAD